MAADKLLEGPPRETSGDLLLADRAFAGAWLVQMLATERRGSLYRYMKERDSSFFPKLWELLFPAASANVPQDQEPLYLLDCSEGHPELHVLTANRWSVFRRPGKIRRYLPYPGKDWILKEVFSWKLFLKKRLMGFKEFRSETKEIVTMMWGWLRDKFRSSKLPDEEY
jgi:hypothetical protein